MAHYFFDTSALKHRYIETPQHAKVSKIVSDKRNACYICDLTILEMAHALGSVCRGNNTGLKKYDAMNSRFFEDIHSGRIEVRQRRGLAFSGQETSLGTVESSSERILAAPTPLSRQAASTSHMNYRSDSGSTPQTGDSILFCDRVTFSKPV